MDSQALGSTAAESEVVFGSRVLAPAELDRVRMVAKECGLRFDDPLAFAYVLREVVGPGGDCDWNRSAVLCARGCRAGRGSTAHTGASHRDSHARLEGRADRPVSRPTESALSRRVRTVEGWLEAEQRRAVREGAVRP
jgi:hypothetical protein